MSVCYEPGSTNWRPGRGDYGTEYAGDMIELIERMNCSLGCTKAGTAKEIAEMGAGGSCPVISAVWAGFEDGIPELDPRPEGPHCRARVDPVTAGMEPLLGEAES